MQEKSRWYHGFTNHLMALCSVWIRGEKGTVRWDQISVRQAALDLNIWVVHERFRRRLTRSRSQVPTFRCNLTDYRNCPASIYTIIYGFVVYKVMYSRSTTLYVFGVIFFPFCEKGFVYRIYKPQRPPFLSRSDKSEATVVLCFSLRRSSHRAIIGIFIESE